MTIRTARLVRLSAATSDGEHVVATPSADSDIRHTEELVREDNREPFVRHTITWTEAAESWGES